MQEWFPWYPSLYATDTLHLTLEQDGIYRRLIDWYMTNRRPLPNNPQALANIARVSLSTWNENAEVLVDFFTKKGKDLHHKRCNAILDDQDSRAKTRGEVARRGAEARWGKVRGDDEGAGSASSEHDAGMLPASDEHASSIPSASQGSMPSEDATQQDRTLQNKTEKKENTPPLPSGADPIQEQSSVPSIQPARSSPAERALSDAGDQASAEDQFWALAERLQADKGVAKSRSGKLLRLTGNDMDEALRVLRDVDQARNPSAYLGAVTRDMGKAQEAATSIVAAVAASQPPWPREVQDHVDDGWPTPERTEAGNWRLGPRLISPTGEILAL